VRVLKSALYTGTLRHRRFSPKNHFFNYNVALFYLDLAEIDDLFRIPFLFSKKNAVLSFRRSDYLGDPGLSLDESVRSKVAEILGFRPEGAIRLLTQIRYLGFCFNPVSFYYCYSKDEVLQAIVAEITNTPWNERHAYVLKCNDHEKIQNFKFEKDFHVSPFLPMEQKYSWSFSCPSLDFTGYDKGQLLSVHMENFGFEGSQKIFDATMLLKSRKLNPWNVFMTLISYPLLTLKAFVAIYFQALFLKLKGIPFYSHPKNKEFKYDNCS
jgi:DUF1365 family protein